jgi:uroporphyrin-3 C-methyltransferase
MVRIERIDRPEPPLLTPEQSFFLRENLRLRLLTARIALLQRDESTCHTDLRAAEDWLKRHFDTTDKNVQNAIASIRQLAGSAINIQLPDISETLNAAGRYKLSLEKTK